MDRWIKWEITVVGGEIIWLLIYLSICLSIGWSGVDWSEIEWIGVEWSGLGRSYRIVSYYIVPVAVTVVK